MLSTSLQIVRQLADTIGNMDMPPGPAVAAKQQITAADDELLPEISKRQADMSDFTARATAEIISLHADSAAPEEAANALHRLGCGFEEQRALIAPLTSRVGQVRDTVTNNVSGMTQQQAGLQAQLAALAGQRKQMSAQLDDLRKRSTVTTVLGSFFPVVKAADEIASAVQYGTTTEGAISEADRRLAQLGSQSQELNAATAACATLTGALTQLTAALQNLANAAVLVGGDLTDDAARAATATPTTLRLYLVSLGTAMAVLGDSIR
ncbi:hypothetical protein [Kitasatospora sp. NPDC085464]|uniref:hypothetical protein n=1 Tax=Kitasatospora sp. NPDC085464 TaxID=3364063 RepID=UPI0037CB50D0